MNAPVPTLPRAPRAARRPPHLARDPGHGSLSCALVDGASAVVGCAAQAPLKLLVPRQRGASAWACAASFGGGLLAGDHLRLEVTVAAGATLVLGTQASTKVYRSDDGRDARQSLDATVGDGAALALLPDPVTAFTGARYGQRQRVALHARGSLLLLDWMTCGRGARDERWAFAGFASRNQVEVDGRPRWLDAMRLDGGAGLAARMGRFHSLATAVLIGPRFAAAATELLTTIAARPVTPRQDLLTTVSALGDGALLRLAGTRHEAVEQALRGLLSTALDAVGGDPWIRRG